VVVVSHDASGNAIGRAIILADLLEPACTVTIAAFGSDVWPVVAHDTRIRLLRPPKSNLGLPQALKRLSRLATNASAIVAVKARALSFGAAGAVRGGRPLLLDLDDFEPAFVQRRLGWFRQLLTPDHLPITDFLMRWRPGNVQVSVASRALQRRYGGTWLPHVRDRDKLLADVRLHREAQRTTPLIGQNELVIGFVGTARAHKGLATLAAAVGRTPGSLLAIVGATDRPKEFDGLLPLAAGRILVLPGPRIDRLGETMAIADVLAVPQSQTMTARYQSPAKLLDGMAAGLPVIAGDVGDAAELLGGTGVLVTTDDIGALAAAISQLADGERRADLAAAARSRYEQRFRLEDGRELVRQQVLTGL
jgi:glycosyltransferase involved in cell wall biosynthesis